MINNKLTFFFNDTRYLIYLLPKELKQGDILTPVFLQRKKKIKQDLSFFQLLRFRELFYTNLKKSLIMKSRCLSIKKGGYSLSYYGCHALFYPSIYSRKKIPTFRGWFSQNLLQYGFLQAFSISKWKIKQISRHQVSNLSSFLPIYYSSLPIFKSSVVLTKPKCSIRKRK